MSDGGAQALVLIGRALGPVIGPVIRIAVRSFFRTTFGLVLLGVGVVAINWYWAAQVGPIHSWLALAATLLLFAVGGCMLSVKRALAAALCSAVDKLDLGPKGLDLLFSQMLDVDDQDEHGERGRDAVRVAENIPLDEAEDRLKGTVTNVLKAPADGGGASGFVRRKLLTTLVRKIELVTLAEFRSEDQSGSGVDLILVRDRLGQEIDDRLLGLLRAASKKTTLLFAVGLVLASFLVTWGINQAPFL
jgi:hypothetical protein